MKRGYIKKFLDALANTLLVISSLKRGLRRAILIFMDLSIIYITCFVCFNIFYQNEFTPNLQSVKFFLLLAFISLPTYIISDQYRGLPQYLGSKYF